MTDTGYETEVTVAITYYNSDLAIFRKCIESVLSQSFHELEILVMVDGTPYDIRHIIREYEGKDSRITFLLSDENHGVSYQRNRAIEKAKGRYLMFVDGDDYIDPVMVELLYRDMEQCDLAMCATDDRVFRMDRTLIDKKVFFSFPERFLKVQYINFSVNKLYKISILREHNINYEEGVVLGEDALFLSRYFAHCHYICCEPHRFYHYLYSTTSATGSFMPEYWDWEIRVIETQWEMFHTYPLSSAQEEYAVYWLYDKFHAVIMYYYERANGTDEALMQRVWNEMSSHALFQRLLSHQAKPVRPWNKSDVRHFQKLKKGPGAYYSYLKRTAMFRTLVEIWNSSPVGDEDEG